MRFMDFFAPVGINIRRGESAFSRKLAGITGKEATQGNVISPELEVAEISVERRAFLP